MHIVYLLLGSNKGHKKKYLLLAQYFLTLKVGRILKKSAIYKTASWGNDKQADYLNQALIIETYLSPFQLLSSLKKIEKLLGRTNKFNNAARTIDIDILFYDTAIITAKNLEIPHPRLHLRNFTLQPLLELNKSYSHPIYNKSIEELAKVCDDTLKVSIFEPKHKV